MQLFFVFLYEVFDLNFFFFLVDKCKISDNFFVKNLRISNYNHPNQNKTTSLFNVNLPKSVQPEDFLENNHEQYTFLCFNKYSILRILSI